MNKFWIVLSHTFLNRVKSKNFIITTLITAILVGVVFSLPSIIGFFEGKDKTTDIGVIDLTGVTTTQIKQQLNNFGYNDLKIIDFDNEQQAKGQLENGKIEGYVIVKENAGKLDVTYKAKQISDTAFLGKIEQALNQVQFKLKAKTLGITETQARQLFETVTINKIPLDENAKTEEEIVQSTVLVYILLFSIYFGVIMYGNIVATEVTKEKSSRVMEILISSVNPIAQMFGKIIGIALVGLLQIIVFVFIGRIAMSFGNKSVDIGDMIVDFSNIPTKTVVFAIIFYILGYLLYSTIAAMLGSIASRVEDLQQTLGPLNLVIVAAFMIAMFGLNKPNTALIVVTSFIPIFTPMIMFLRVGVANPALWEVLLSIGLLVFTIVLFAIFAAKVYRGGVLMYGKGSSLKSIKKAIKLRNGN